MNVGRLLFPVPAAPSFMVEVKTEEDPSGIVEAAEISSI